MAKAPALVVDTLTSQPDVLQTEWLTELKKQGTGADHRISESELGQQSRELLQLLGAAVATGTDIQAEPWRAARDFLERLSRARAQQGFTSSETATFVFSLKRPLFARIRAASKDATAVGDATWATTELIDALALHTVADLPEEPRGRDHPPAGRPARAVDAGGQAVGRRPRAADDRHARQRADPGRHGVAAAADRRDRLRDRDHRHHRRADRRHAGRAAPASRRSPPSA